jgi:GNAT superfamily N-acetyltransferase
MIRTATGGSPRIEPLTAADAEPLAALAAAIWRDHYPAIITTAQIDYMLRQRYDPAVIRAELEREDLWWDKLLVGEELCAFSSYLLTGTAGEMKIDKLYVRTCCQRRGFGGLLLAHAAEVAIAQGCKRLMLAVNKNNGSAIAAYAKHGFRVAEAVVKDIGGGFVMDDYIMVRAL